MNEGRTSGRFARFCIVGIGNHARSKLIPAIEANGQEIAGLVTRGEGVRGLERFRRIEEAVAALPSDTVFVLATPPALHFAQAMQAIKGGRDVIIEKPAFVTAQEATDAAAEAAQRGSVLIEGFMHRHTEIYRRLLQFWHSEQHTVTDIDAIFLIPEVPAGTFRHEANVTCSSLYDMGAYALSLLSDLDLPLRGLQIDRIDFPGEQSREAVSISGALGDIRSSIRVGVGATYINRVSLRTTRDDMWEFSRFFYGRPGQKLLSRSQGSAKTSETIQDGNAFEQMFAVPRCSWLGDQPKRVARMIDVTATLERLGAALAATRGRNER